MSSETTHSVTESPCDKLLDYAYGELASGEVAAFEQHLLTCEKCIGRAVDVPARADRGA
jgi:hypothetical protein